MIANHENLLVGGRQELLVRQNELFPEPLAGPETHHFDGYVAARLQARQADQILGEVHDPDRFTHVEEEHLTTCAHGPRLEHELSRLRREHEVSGGVGIGDCDRPAAGHLPVKDGQHAPVRP